jgi:hypothetical protein
MPETITREYTVYTFDELSDKAKEHALLKHIEWIDNDWDVGIIDNFKEQGSDRGFNIDDVRYTLAYSQGDGAAWYGGIDAKLFLDYHLKDDDPDYARYIVLRELLREDWLKLHPQASYGGFKYHLMQVSINCEYSTLNFNDGEVMESGVLQGANIYELGEGINDNELIDKLEEWMQAEAKSYAEDIFDALRDEYEYQTSAENFKELCDANEWRFDEQGSLFV